MGTWYCNFTLNGPSNNAVLGVLEQGKRAAFVSPTFSGKTVVYERISNKLGEADVRELGEFLSRELPCPVLAAVNGDDDELWLGLFDGGAIRAEYSSRGRNRGAWRISLAFGRPWATPFAWVVLQFPYLLSESFRHMLLAKLLGIPAAWVISGYKYIAEGDGPEGLQSDDFGRTTLADAIPQRQY